MTRYTGRQLPGTPSLPGGTGGFMNFTKQLVARRGVARAAPKKIAPVKPSLTTSKQKEGEISKLIDTRYMPSGMQLAELRQLAAAGKVLSPKEARDFLHRSEAGKKLDTREGLQKFEAELLKAELLATKDAVKSPIRYKYRQGGEAHIDQKAKQLVKGLYQDSAKQAQEQAAESSHLNALQERQARLATLHAAMRPTAPAPATAPGVRPSSTPTLQAVGPLSVPTQTIPHTGSPLVAPPSGVGSHVPGTYSPTSDPTVGLGMPVVKHGEVLPPPPQASEPTPPSMPVFHEPEPLDQPLPPRPAVPTETGSVSSDVGVTENKE